MDLGSHAPGECEEELDAMNFDWDEELARLVAGDNDAALKTAKKLSEMMIHLHDGKDYIDDMMPKLDAVLESPTPSLLVKTYIALATVRMLAHGWDWEPDLYLKLLSIVKSALLQGDDETKAIAVLTIDQIFLADNDSDTEAGDKTDAAVLKLLSKALLPGAEKGKPRQNISDYLHDTLSPFLTSPCAGLIENASSLLGRLPQRKRGRAGGDATSGAVVPKGFVALVQRLQELVGSTAVDVGQISAVLKGIARTLPEAAFEVMEDIIDEDMEHFPKVADSLWALNETLPRVFALNKATKGVADTYHDVKFENEEKCPQPHWDQATGALATLLAIRSSPRWQEHCTKSNREEWASPVTEDQLHTFLLAWRSHRYHKLGADFELVEAAVAYIAKQHESLWKACAAKVPLCMTWTCVPDPFAPPEARPQFGLRGFGAPGGLGLSAGAPAPGGFAL